MMVFSIIAIVFQLVILWLWWNFSSRKSDPVFLRYFNPTSFVALFYVLFFMLEQVAYLINGYDMVGVGGFAISSVAEVYFNTQCYLILFLLFTILGFMPTRFFAPANPTKYIAKAFSRRETPAETALLIVFFVVGLVATIYLARTLMSMQGFRSQLVKSSDGLAATTVSFFGNFSFAFLVYKLARDKKYLWCALVAVSFGVAVFYTGSRGRLLWPMAIAIALFFSSKNKLPVGRLIAFALIALSILSILDPLRKYLSDGGANMTMDDLIPFQTLFESRNRNFDGFANFALITGSHLVVPHLSNLFTGARDVFMNTFFPAVYNMGVAFGSTLPGYFYIVGGVWGIILMSTVFGLILGIVNNMIARTTSPWLLGSYLFGIVWFAAVGGDFVESFRKMIAAMAPGPVIIFACWAISDVVYPFVPGRWRINRQHRAMGS